MISRACPPLPPQIYARCLILGNCRHVPPGAITLPGRHALVMPWRHAAFPGVLSTSCGHRQALPGHVCRHDLSSHHDACVSTSIVSAWSLGQVIDWDHAPPCTFHTKHWAVDNPAGHGHSHHGMQSLPLAHAVAVPQAWARFRNPWEACSVATVAFSSSFLAGCSAPKHPRHDCVQQICTSSMDTV